MARFTKRDALWVVYRSAARGNIPAANVVCEQSEWDEMEKERPGVNTLIRGGIADEAEAEKLARGTSGDTYRKGIKG